jgi:hypothetical protein
VTSTGVEQFGRYRDLLLRAHQIGADEAIAELAGDSEVFSPELRAALAALDSSLAAGVGPPGQLVLVRQALAHADQDGTPKMWVSLQGMLGEMLLRQRTGDRGQHVDDGSAARVGDI